MPVDSDSLGTYLRQERERRQVSLQEIAVATKIQLKFLEALENDAYDQLPAAPFVVGFLRAYAQQIALDPEAILTAYRSLQHTPETGEDRPVSGVAPISFAPRLPRVRWLVFLLVLALGLGLALYEFRQGRQAQHPVASFPALPPALPPMESVAQESVAKESVAKEGVTKPAVSGLPRVAQTASPEPAVASAPPPAASAVAAPQEAVPPPGTRAADPVQTTPVAAGAVPPQSSAGPPAAKVLRLILQAQALEDTWLRLEIDGQKPFSLLLNSGKSIEWEALERFRLTIGNARGTRLALNGQDIALSPGRSNVIRNLSLTRSSLQ